MGTKVYGNYQDLITFTRASGGHALRPVSYGTELVTNGGFDTDSDWTKGTGWTISGGAAVSNNASGYGDVRQNLSLTANKIYRLEFSVTSYTSGVVKPYLGNSGNSLAEPYGRGNLTAGLTADSAGDFYAFFVYDASQISQILFRSNNGFIGSIDNVSIKEVTFDQPDGTLTLFEHPDNIPRVEWDADRNRLGLLVEEQRVNLQTYSSDFSSGWNKLTSFATANALEAPNGTTTAVKFGGTVGATNMRLTQTVSLTSGTTYTYSIFAKAGEFTTLRTQRYDTNLDSWATEFDLSSGTITSGIGKIQDVGDGWYRCSGTIVCNTTATTGVLYVCEPNGTGDGTSGIYVWGAQLEAGSFPTSYIKTTGSSATRSADVASIPVADFGYNQSAGTLVTTVETFDADYGSYAWTINGTNDTFAYTHSSGAWRIAGAGGTVAYVGSLPSDDFFKLGYAFDESGSAALADGGSVTSPSHSQPTEVQTLHVGGTANSTAQLNGHIKSIKYYPRRLTNAQLVELTS